MNRGAFFFAKAVVAGMKARRDGRIVNIASNFAMTGHDSMSHYVAAKSALLGLTKAAAGEDTIFAGDGRGGFIIPEFSPTVDGIAAFIRMLGLVARTRLTLFQIDHRIPEAHLLKRSVPTPWAAKGSVMRHVVEAAGRREVDTTDGVRVIEDDTSWILVLPDPSEAVTHLWAEAADRDSAQDLLEDWAGVVEGAGS